VETPNINMQLIISKSGKTWTGIILRDNRLFYSTYNFPMKEKLLTHLKSKCNCDVEVIEDEHPIIKVINNIVNGVNYDIPKIEFDFSGYTNKEIKVLKALLKVPVGKTVSYGELAKLAGLPNAARFVGNVMAKNRFAPIIPCHRVILSNGKLGNFSSEGGVELKKKLLMQESKLFFNKQ